MLLGFLEVGPDQVEQFVAVVLRIGEHVFRITDDLLLVVALRLHKAFGLDAQGLDSLQAFVSLGVEFPAGVGDIGHLALVGFIVAEEFAAAGRTRGVGLALGAGEVRGDFAELPAGLIGETLLEFLADRVDPRVDRRSVLALDRDRDWQGKVIGVDLHAHVVLRG